MHSRVLLAPLSLAVRATSLGNVDHLEATGKDVSDWHKRQRVTINIDVDATSTGARLGSAGTPGACG